MRSLYFRVAWCLWWALFVASAVHANTLVIVSSDGSAAYAEAVDAVVAELAVKGVSADNVMQTSAAQLREGRLPKSSVRVYLTLGADALRQVLMLNPREPVVAALIPKGGFERVAKESGKKTGAPLFVLYLDQPFARQLDLLKIALPQARRVGVLLGPESAPVQGALTGMMRNRGLELVVGQAETGAALFSGLRAAIDDVDVLLAVPDAQVFNSTTITNILVTTYRMRVPVIAFSAAYVRAGALLSLYSTPVQIGTQAAGLARNLYFSGEIPTSQYPSDFTVRINENVAQSLGLKLDAGTLTEQLRRTEARP